MKAMEGLMLSFRKTIVLLNTTKAVVVLIPGLHARDGYLKTDALESSVALIDKF